MKRTTTLKQGRTNTRPGKEPYIYAFPSTPVSGTTGNSSPPSTMTVVKRSSNRTEAMPAHWRQAIV
jgi:hypothetical protein